MARRRQRAWDGARTPGGGGTKQQQRPIRDTMVLQNAKRRNRRHPRAFVACMGRVSHRWPPVRLAVWRRCWSRIASIFNSISFVLHLLNATMSRSSALQHVAALLLVGLALASAPAAAVSSISPWTTGGTLTFYGGAQDGDLCLEIGSCKSLQRPCRVAYPTASNAGASAPSIVLAHRSHLQAWTLPTHPMAPSTAAAALARLPRTRGPGIALARCRPPTVSTKATPCTPAASASRQVRVQGDAVLASDRLLQGAGPLRNSSPSLPAVQIQCTDQRSGAQGDCGGQEPEGGPPPAAPPPPQQQLQQPPPCLLALSPALTPPATPHPLPTPPQVCARPTPRASRCR